MQNKNNQPVYQSILTGLTAERDRVQFLIEPSSIYDFFKKHNIRKIPDYQRPYSWSEQHILDLLNDIRKIAEGDRESWFLGPIFTTKLTPNDIESQLLE